MKRLPRSLDDLRGLRAARWFRESTRGQWDNYGPEAQRDQQDRSIERFGLVDTGIEWSVAHSGYRKDRQGRAVLGSTEQWLDMKARAGVDFDVLLVGYTSRFARDTELLLAIRREFHSVGAAIFLCDERVLTSDEDQWELYAREAVDAEAYSHKLAKRIREGYEAKYRRLADPGGRPAKGFVRSAERPYTLRIDPETMSSVVAMFDRYAAGTLNISALAAEFGMADRTVNDILKNPLYNGWVGRKGDRSPAPWRGNPPVNDGLWERVQALMAQRVRAGGPPSEVGRVDLLKGLVYCVCGRRVKADGMGGEPRKPRRLHLDPCPVWGPARTNTDFAYTIASQLGHLRWSDKVKADLVAILSKPAQPTQSLDGARNERRRRELALDYAAGRIDERQFLRDTKALREAEPEPTVGYAITPDEAVAAIENWRATWEDPYTDDESRAALIHAIYQKVIVERDRVVRVDLTPAAEALGLPLLLPEQWRVSALARPTGVDRAVALVFSVHVTGAAEWRAARRSA